MIPGCLLFKSTFFMVRWSVDAAKITSCPDARCGPRSNSSWVWHFFCSSAWAVRCALVKRILLGIAGWGRGRNYFGKPKISSLFTFFSLLGKLGPKKFSYVQLNLGQELSRHNSHPPPDLPCLRHYRTYAIHLQEKCLEQQVLSRSVEQLCRWGMIS